MELEEWKDIQQFPDYKISNFGNVYSKKSKKNLKPYKHPNGGHLRVTLFKNRRRYRFWVHELVLEAFSSKRPSESHVCRHLDSNPENNHIENLKWGTLIDNTLDRFENPNDNSIKVNMEKIIEIKTMLLEGKKPVEIAEITNIGYSIVSNIKNCKNWKNVGVDLSCYDIKKKKRPISKEIVKKIKKMIADGFSNKEISEIFNIRRNYISCIRCGYRFKDV